jgi:hypothetical protein
VLDCRSQRKRKQRQRQEGGGEVTDKEDGRRRQVEYKENIAMAIMHLINF